MKVATWNVNSIRARLDRVVAWLEEHQPDALCMQETKVTDDAFPALELEAAGYKAEVWGQKSYNGVAILARERPTNVRCGFEDGGDDMGSRFMDARVGDVRLLTAYVPNGRRVDSEYFPKKLQWLARLHSYLAKHCSKNESLVLCGDMNVAPEAIDVHNPEIWEGKVLFHPDERAALAELRNWGLIDTVRAKHPEDVIYSWWDYRMLGFPKNRGLRIDHIFATRPLAAKLADAYVDRNARKGKLPSDHAPVVAEFS